MSKKAKLFYSYSHKDATFREGMDEALSLLRRNGLLKEWHDRNIVPGEKITTKILEALDSSDIVVFLLSPSFLNSDACVEEWDHAKSLSQKSKKTLISIIVRDCPWQDFDDAKDYKALPYQGKAISNAANTDAAWKEVYDGIKEAIEASLNDFSPRQNAIRELSTLEYKSESRNMVLLDDLFVFPELVEESDRILDNKKNTQVRSATQILDYQKCLISGEELCGKTKLGVHIFNEILESGKPALFIDLETIKQKKANENIFASIYTEYFSGDYDLWKNQKGKTIIFDNLTSQGNCLDFIDLADNIFDNVVVLTSANNYSSYFMDELRLSKYHALKILSFTHHKQEQLIKKWLDLKKADESEGTINHNLIDKIERDINSVIINNKILPRYPFYILSILQTYEAFMPQNMKITAYGHCYYALILANLIKSGIDQKDESIDACFTFLSEFALCIHSDNNGSSSISEEKYNEFLIYYNAKYILSKSLLNRMTNPNGVLTRDSDGEYRFSFLYTYYFFLGRYIAINYESKKELVSHMLENSQEDTNSLSLIFAIHHAQDVEIIDDILLHTFCLADSVEPAELNQQETSLFYELLSTIPERILSDNSVENEREMERNARDHEEQGEVELRGGESTVKNEGAEEEADIDSQTVYRTIKNMEILSQILKNKYGSLEKPKVQEIVEGIADAGLRLINLVLSNEKMLEALSDFIAKRMDYEVSSKKHLSLIEKQTDIRKLATTFIFVYTMSNLEKIVNCLSKPEIRDVLHTTVQSRNTPAYDIINYFFSLDNASKFDENLRLELDKLLDRYSSNDLFFTKKVVSLRTQFYMNTHTISAPLKQAISSSLKIDYRP